MLESVFARSGLQRTGAAAAARPAEQSTTRALEHERSPGQPRVETSTRMDWKIMKHASAGAASARPEGLTSHSNNHHLDDLDMTGVDPLRVEEVRRRIAVVLDYLAESAPDVASRRRHARSLGLSVNQFLALVRAWREHGRAVAISGAGAARGMPRADVPRSLPLASKDAARAVIAALGPDVPHVDAVRAIKARCAELGVKAPSPSSVWNMVMSARRATAQPSHNRDVIVSRCNLKLPVQVDGTIVFPSIILVVDSVNGEIIAASMSGKDRNPSIARDEVVRRLAGRDIVADAEIAPELRNVDGARVRPVKASVARTVTAKVLGRGFGTVELIYQLNRAIDPARALRARKDKPLRQADADRFVLQQMQIHNRARGAATPLVVWRD